MSKANWKLNDLQVVTFKGDKAGEEFHDYLLYRKETDQWLQMQINTLSAIPIAKEPLFRKDDAQKAVYYRHGINYPLNTAIDVDDPAVSETVDAGFFLVAIETDGKFEAKPVRYTAFSSLLERSGTNCEAMTLTENKEKKHPVDIHRKADWFNWAKDQRDKYTVMLFRDGKIGYAGSESYEPLCPYEGMKLLEAAIRADHPNFSFLSGMASHEYLFGEYLLNDVMMESSLQSMLSLHGFTYESVRAGVRYSTSEVGTNSMTAKCFFEVKGKEEKQYSRIELPGEVYVTHTGKAGDGLKRWEDELKKLGTIFKESEDRFEQLGNIEIQDVCVCLQAIRNTYTFLPMKETQDVVESLRTEHPDGKGTAMDVFIAINEIASKLYYAPDLTPSRYINMAEQVQKLIYLDYADIDRRGECLRKKA